MVPCETVRTFVRTFCGCMSDYSSEFSEAESGTGSPPARLLDDKSSHKDVETELVGEGSRFIAETGFERDNGQVALDSSVLSGSGAPETAQTPSPIVSDDEAKFGEDSETDGLTEEELRQLEKQWIVEEEKRIFDEKARKQEDELLHQRQYMDRFYQETSAATVLQYQWPGRVFEGPETVDRSFQLPLRASAKLSSSFTQRSNATAKRPTSSAGIRPLPMAYSQSIRPKTASRPHTARTTLKPIQSSDKPVSYRQALVVGKPGRIQPTEAAKRKWPIPKGPQRSLHYVTHHGWIRNPRLAPNSAVHSSCVADQPSLYAAVWAGAILYFFASSIDFTAFFEKRDDGVLLGWLDLESVLTIAIDTVESDAGQGAPTLKITDDLGNGSTVQPHQWPCGLRYISLTHSNGIKVCLAPDLAAVDENARIAQLKIEAGFALLKQRDAPTAASKDKEPRVFSFVTETADDDNASRTVEAVPLKQQLRLADYAVKASAARLSVSHDAAFDAWWNALVIPFKKLARAQVSRGVGKTTYNVQRFVNVSYESKLHVDSLPESLVKKVDLLMNTAAVVAFQSPFDGLIDEAAGTSTPGPTRKNDSKFYIRMRRFGERSVDSLPALTPVASTTSQPVIRTFPTTGLKYAKETVIPSRPRDDGATPVPVSSPSLHLGVVVSVDTFHGVLRPHGLQSRTESRIVFVLCETAGDVGVGDLVLYRPRAMKDSAPFAHLTVSKTVLAADVSRLIGLNFTPLDWLASVPVADDVINIVDMFPPSSVTKQPIPSLNAPTVVASTVGNGHELDGEDATASLIRGRVATAGTAGSSVFHESLFASGIGDSIPRLPSPIHTYGLEHKSSMEIHITPSRLASDIARIKAATSRRQVSARAPTRRSSSPVRAK